MRRGFKSEAERRSISARVSLGINPIAPLCPWDYASHLGILVLAADELELESEHAEQLFVRDPDSWSGLSLQEDGEHVVVLNPTHPRTRQSATLMHEIAHIVLDHVPAEVTVSPSGLVLLSEYSPDQEDEADWLGAALLLPEQALLKARRLGHSHAQIATAFGVSEAICQWRCRMTGVERRIALSRSW